MDGWMAFPGCLSSLFSGTVLPITARVFTCCSLVWGWKYLCTTAMRTGLTPAPAVHSPSEKEVKCDHPVSLNTPSQSWIPRFLSHWRHILNWWKKNQKTILPPSLVSPEEASGTQRKKGGGWIHTSAWSQLREMKQGTLENPEGANPSAEKIRHIQRANLLKSEEKK